MKNFKMKNVILGIMIAVMSIACFAVVGVTLNNTPKYEKEQGVHIAGLEFEDGWNLISDADDYYLMTENTSTGKNAGAKYRLTNDITINPYKAKQDAFIGATLDGAGYKVMVDNNAQLEMEASDEPKYVQENTQSSEPEYVEDELVGAAKFNGRTLKALSHTKEDGTTISVFPWLNSNVDGGSNSTKDKSQAIYPCSLYSQYQDYTVGCNGYKFNTSGYYEIAQLGGGSYAVDDGIEVIAIGGMYGAIVEGVVSNLSIQYNGDVTFSGSITKDDSVCFGLFAGYVYNSSVYNCMVYVNYNTAQNRGVQVIANNTQDNSTFAYFIGQYYQKTTETKWIPIGTTIKPDPSIVVPGNYINNNFVFYSGSSPDNLFSISNPFSNYKEGDINIEMKYGSVWLEHVVTYTVGTGSLSSTKIFNIFSDLRECYHLAPSTAYTDASQYEGIYKSSADYFSADSSDRNNHWAMIPGIHDGTLFQTHYMSDYAYTVKLDPGEYTLGDDCGYKKIGSIYYKVIGKEQKLGKLPTPSGLDSSMQKYNWVTPGGSIVTSEVVVKRDLTLKLNVTGVSCQTHYYGKNTTTGIDGAPVSFNDSSYAEAFRFSYGGTVKFKTLDAHEFNHSTPPPVGYHFEGWCTDSSAEWVDYEAGETYDGVTPNNGNILHLYAVYRPYNYYIFIDPLPTVQYAGDMSIYDDITGLEGEEYKVNDRDGFCLYKSYGSTIELPTLTRKKYDFDGWYTSWDPEKQEYSGKVEGTTFVVPNNDTTLYVKWKKQLIKVNVTLDYNYKESPDGEENKKTLKGLEYGNKYSNQLPSPPKPGYNFLGWTSDYLDVSSFIWYYTSGGGKNVREDLKPYVTDDGWLCLNGAMAWDGTQHWGYPIYLPNGNYQLSATAQGDLDNKGRFGGSLMMVASGENYAVPGNYYGLKQFGITGAVTGSEDDPRKKSSVCTVNDESGGIQFCLFHSYNTGNNVYYKDIRITRLEEDDNGTISYNDKKYTEAKYQGIYERPNELRIIDAGSAVIAPYDHTLYANWSEELDAIEFVVDAENPENPKMVVSALQYKGEDGIEFNGEDYYINLGRKYMFEDCLYVSVDAYMDDWAQLGVGTLISCTQGGGWRLAADDNNTGKIEFELSTTNNTEYTFVQSKTVAGTLSPGWHTFTAMYDGSEMALYIDNILQEKLGVTGKISYNGTNSIFVGGEATSLPSEPSLGDWGFKGKMRNLYIANTPFSQSYYHDGKIIFDGEGGECPDYIDLGTQYQFTDSLYISFMAYMEDWDEYKSKNMQFMSCNADDGALGWEFIIDDQDKISFLAYHSQGSIIIRAKKSISDFLDNTWYKFKVVWDGSKVYYYINEELQNDSEVTLSEIAYSSDISICLGREGLGEGFFKGALSNIYISNGKPGHTEMFNVTGQSYQRFPALVNTSEGYKFIGWKLSGDRALDGTMLGNDIFFYNGLGFKKYGNDDYDGQILLGFTSSMEMDNGTVYSSGFARLIAIYDDTTIPTPDDWTNPGGGKPEPGDDNEIQDPQPDLNITVFTIELQYEDANIEDYNPSSEKASFDGIYIIYFDGHGGFALPDLSHVTRYGYTFDKWQVVSSDNTDCWVYEGSKIVALANGKNVNAKLEAVWTENVYKVVVQSDVGGVGSKEYYLAHRETSNYQLNLSLTDIFALQHTIVGSKGVGGYRFVGWAITNSDAFTYDYFQQYYKTTGSPQMANTDITSKEDKIYAQLCENWGGVELIWHDGITVSRLIHGYATEDDANADGAYKVNIYAIWTPIYTVTIDANMDGVSHKCAKGTSCDECGIYVNGTRSVKYDGEYIVPQTDNKTDDTITTQHYFQGYSTPTHSIDYVFGKPDSFGLHYYGHEIYAWAVQVDGETYKLDYKKDKNGKYIEDENGNYILEDGENITDWIKGGYTDTVPSGKNLRYLQGNITLMPQWRPLEIDVIFKTASTEEEYKQGFTGTQTSEVEFGSQYNITNDGGDGIYKIQYTDISNYSLIYTHPYYTQPYNKTDVVDSDTYITTTGNWGYMLDYKKRDKVETGQNQFYIEIEGYYAPKLYKVKLELDLPYDTTVTPSITAENLPTNALNQYPMSPYIKYDSEVYSEDKYIRVNNETKYMYNKTDYQNYQHKLFTQDGAYYIYLLHDQVVWYDTSGAYIENKYYNGKTAKNEQQRVKTNLPTFEIDYYQMQYYYTSTTPINMYQTAELKQYHEDLAKDKLTGGDNTKTVAKGSDWKYEYSSLIVYWYRNILNLDIENILHPNGSTREDKNTTVGYVLVTENEQITEDDQGIKRLIDHNIYHLVIYAYKGEQLSYVVYGFDSLGKLGSESEYKYIQLLGKTDVSDLKLENLKGASAVVDIANVINNNGKYIPIYFGNSITIEAVDQRKDQSLDEFIGYRFKEYEYVTDECKNTPSINNVTVDNSNPCKVTINLQNYEYGKDFTDDGEDNPNTTNYFVDQDVLTIKAHFEPIKYIFNYQTVNETLDKFEPAGKVEVKYDGPRINSMPSRDSGYEIAYYLNVDNEANMTNNINIQLGYEHDYWLFNNGKTDISFGNGESLFGISNSSLTSQEIVYTINAQFLRRYYAGISYTSYTEQNIYVYSVCKPMNFGVKVYVKDISTNKIVSGYEGVGSDNLFTIEQPLQLGMTKYIDMADKGVNNLIQATIEGKGYILKNMYVDHNMNSSLYPVTYDLTSTAVDTNNLRLVVDISLLKSAINYTEGVEVIEDNRFLNFYIDAAPIVVFDFNITNAGLDKQLSDRKLTIDGVTVASGSKGTQFTGTLEQVEGAYRYIGYYGQRLRVGFSADKKYYQGVDINVVYISSEGDQVEEGVNIGVGNMYYTLKGNSKAEIQVVPKTYTADVKIYYSSSLPDMSNWEEMMNEGSDITNYENIINASGVQVFSSAGVMSTTSTTGVYYYGDKLTVTYALNPEISKDMQAAVYYNKNEATGSFEDGEYTTEIVFNGSNLEVVIYVYTRPSAVILTTNMPSLHTADISVSVSDGTPIMVQGKEIKDVAINLTSGQTLTVYVKEQVGFRFDKTYKVLTGENIESNATKVDKVYVFNMFTEGFSSDMLGVYTLNFTQIPIEVRFEHHLIYPGHEKLDIPVTYTATSDTRTIQLGSEVTLTKEQDPEGYRFEKYTYKTYSGEGSVDLNLTKIDEVSDKFTIDSTILDYLSTVTEEDGKLPLVIYVNYVRQYTFNIEANNETIVKVYGIDGEEMDSTKYYDHGTEFKVSIQTKDTEHYMIESKINGEDASVSSGTEQYTNLGHVSGFTSEKYELNETCSIRTEAVAEKYTIQIKQKVYDGSEGEREYEIVKQEGWYKWLGNIYYRTSGDFSYNSEVEIYILISTPKMGQENYAEGEITREGKSILGQGTKTAEGTEYTIKYKVAGEYISGTMLDSKITVLFNKLYCVTLN